MPLENQELALRGHNGAMDALIGETSTSTKEFLVHSRDESMSSVLGRTTNVSLGKKRAGIDVLAKPIDQQPTDSSTQDMKSRVQYIKVGIDDTSNQPTSTTTRSSEDDPEYAFAVMDFYNKSHVKEKTDIILKGKELRKIMYNVMGGQLKHQQIQDWEEQEQTIDQPITNEIWYWNELWEEAESNRGSEQGRQDLQLLLNQLADMKRETVKFIRTISTATRVMVKDLWCLFRPGTLVISKPYQDEPQLFRVHKSEYKETIDAKVFAVVAWAFSWTGTELIQEYYSFRIRQFNSADEEVIITTDLPCYPLRYYRNSNGTCGTKAVEALKSDLLTRGREFRGLCKESVRGRRHTYDGEFLTDQQETYPFRDRKVYRTKKQTTKGEIMIDFTAYKQYGPSSFGAIGHLCPISIVACKCPLCFDEKANCAQWMQRFAGEDPDNESVAENSNYMLLPARLLGYSFSTKAWAQFHVGRVGDIRTIDAEKMMEKLIFPEESEDVKGDLRILIEQHGSTQVPLIVDPIEGKGAGLVILLHGPPGVGKTLTAETLAKSAGKPLYVVGASDIGLEPEAAEATLGRLFELAERWGAVLLIDEADVFLDSRGSKGEADIQKNALVSVMLRVLEYFKGILIMTTNRVMTFDVAMLSRCHYAVNFKSLTVNQEKSIWMGYVDQLTDRNSSQKPEIEAWVKQITKKGTKLSGREIRNVFTTAQTLAQAEPNKKVRKYHLERVYDRLMDFSEAMKEIKNRQQLQLNAPYS